MSISTHLKPKSLMLYAVAIGSVVILFNLVSQYGEANVKARPNLNERYRLSGDKLPPCLTGKSLVLSIQQSGVYLNANLSTLATKKDGNVKETFPLKGKWENQNFQLSGSIPPQQICPTGLPGLSSDRELLVKIEAGLADNKAPETSVKQNIPLVGQITLNNSPDRLSFTAQPDSGKSPDQPSTH
jgi:hypothetical protein